VAKFSASLTKVRTKVRPNEKHNFCLTVAANKNAAKHQKGDSTHLPRENDGTRSQNLKLQRLTPYHCTTRMHAGISVKPGEFG
jgi:hypothetical protein